MTPLSKFAANRCEQAKDHVCKCRCNGALHGAKRVADGGDYSLLPTDDPHYRPSMTRKEAIKFLGDAHYRVLTGSNYGDYNSPEYRARYEALRILTDARESLTHCI